MWKFGKEEEKQQQPPVTAVTPESKNRFADYNQFVTVPKETSVETRPSQNYPPEVAHIGKSVVVKGELSGSEDLYVDGEVEGSIELNDHSLTIGPNGRLRANVRARDIIVEVNRHGVADAAACRRAIGEGRGKAVLLLIKRHRNTVFVPLEPEG